jgi:hypothetical protein
MLASDLDVVCLSHLRWDWMWQRPQHLLSRCARSRRVFYVQEAEADGTTRLEVERTESGVYAVTPHVPDNLERRRCPPARRAPESTCGGQRRLLYPHERLPLRRRRSPRPRLPHAGERRLGQRPQPAAGEVGARRPAHPHHVVRGRVGERLISSRRGSPATRPRRMAGFAIRGSTA